MAITYSGFDSVSGKYKYFDGANFSLSDQPPSQTAYNSYASENGLTQSYSELLTFASGYQTPPSAPVAATNSGTNPSGTSGANTAVNDSGATVQTFDDGSTLTTNKDGTTSSTPAPSDAVAQASTANANSASPNLDQLLAQGKDLVAQGNSLLDQRDAAAAAGDTAGAAAFQAQADALLPQISANNAAILAATDGSSVTNPSSTDLSGGTGLIDPASGAKNAASLNSGASSGFGINFGQSGAAGGLRAPLNSLPKNPVAAIGGFGSSQDMRVKLRIPSNYLTGPAAGPSGILTQLGGILFPYTPQVGISNVAAYAQNKVTHSNYQFYNFQNSSVGPITVSGKFTAQNEYEAAIILSVQHVLRALTKMKWGNDQNAGAPPPICRFDAYGDYQMKNIPVAVADFKVELPDGVDYIAVGRGIKGYGNTMVPTSCTISITLNIMYSRQEVQNYGVDAWLAGSLAGKGFL
jgi:hypothetical protein